MEGSENTNSRECTISALNVHFLKSHSRYFCLLLCCTVVLPECLF